MALSLYQLIKQKSQEKGRPLKIICDWDDVIQAHKPFSLYVIENPKVSFNEWFEVFWDKVRFIKLPGAENKRAMRYSYVFDNLEDDDYKRLGVEKEKFDKSRKNRDEFALRKLVARLDKDFYDKAPFLSISKELIQALKEGSLIKELLIVSSYRKGRYKEGGDPRKISKFQVNFGRFPQCKLILIPLEVNEAGDSVPFRWTWTKENHPDFDLFIDDNQGTVVKTSEVFNHKKTFVMPEYKNNEEKVRENIYRVKTTVSDLKDIHFAIGALEYRTKKIEQGIRELKPQAKVSSSEPVPTRLIAFPIISLVLVGLVWMVVWKSKSRK